MQLERPVILNNAEHAKHAQWVTHLSCARDERMDFIDVTILSLLMSLPILPHHCKPFFIIKSWTAPTLASSVCIWVLPFLVFLVQNMTIPLCPPSLSLSLEIWESATPLCDWIQNLLMVKYCADRQHPIIHPDSQPLRAVCSVLRGHPQLQRHQVCCLITDNDKLA